jgi:hypothetical protein
MAWWKERSGVSRQFTQILAALEVPIILAEVLCYNKMCSLAGFMCSGTTEAEIPILCTVLPRHRQPQRVGIAILNPITSQI